MEREKELDSLEAELKLSFINKTLLNQALTHSSFGHEFDVRDNERLEFLGDAVLKLVISEHIFHKYPNKAEGDLTKIRAQVISDETLAKIARQFNLGRYLLLSTQEKRTGGSKRKSNLANAFEAVIGATFLDAGIGRARQLVLEFLEKEIELKARKGFISDFKSALQEFVQKKGWTLPHYVVLKATGPKHRQVFLVGVKIKGRYFGYGKGFSKKEGERRAAKAAYMKIKREGGGKPRRRFSRHKP